MTENSKQFIIDMLLKDLDFLIDVKEKRVEQLQKEMNKDDLTSFERGIRIGAGIAYETDLKSFKLLRQKITGS